MKKFVSLLAAGAVCALALSVLSGAATKITTWTAALSSGQEVPKQVVKNANAHGLFKATLSGTTLKWKLTYAKLTGPATAAHIHMPAKGRRGRQHHAARLGRLRHPAAGEAAAPYTRDPARWGRGPGRRADRRFRIQNPPNLPTPDLV